MNLTLQISPELEAKLKEQAAALGKPLEHLALEAIEERCAVDVGKGPNRSASTS